MTHRYDLLVIGTGIAGLSFALKASRFGSVAIVTKKERAESNTNYAQGGVAAVMSQVDSFFLHVNDTMGTGVGLCHRDAVETMVREGPDRLRDLIEIGAKFTYTDGHLDLGREREVTPQTGSCTRRTSRAGRSNGLCFMAPCRKSEYPHF